MNARPSLLDAGTLPVAEIAALAQREGARPRAHYQTHRWFARRFAVTARSLLVASRVSQGFWDAYYAGPSYEGLTVLDPFMGGGVMLLEAARLGAHVVGVDVEPVPAAICALQSRLGEMPNLDDALRQVAATVESRVARYYRTHTATGEERLLVHAFWVQRLDCGACGAEYDCHPSYRLAWDEGSNTQWIVCRGCGEILQRPLASTKCRCSCGVTTFPDRGNGADGIVTCPECRSGESVVQHASRRGTPRFRLAATESISWPEDGRQTLRLRRLAKATREDEALYEEAARELKAVLTAQPDAIADASIPTHGRRDSRPLLYGYRRYSELYNARQLLHLCLLAAEIDKLEGPAREALAVAFSDHLTTNNMMCAYAGGWRRLTPLFSLRSFRHVTRPVELNPWLRKNGRGTFPNAVRAITRAANALRNSEEPLLDGGIQQVPSRLRGSWDVRCNDAGNMDHVPDRSVDLVLTDPPYFDYINYSELGHFFVPWLSRFGLVDACHLDGFPSGQIAAIARSAEASARFRDQLTAALHEVARVAKADARIVFTFQNRNVRGWELLASAMGAAGIIPRTVFPMMGESGPNLHKHEKSVSWDAVLVCTLGASANVERFSEQSRSGGAKFADRWRTKLQNAGVTLGSGDVMNLGHAGALLAAFKLVATRIA